MLTFGLNLKKMLEERGMTMTELSKKTGITYNMIKKYCSGLADPTISYAQNIASVLETSLDTMMDYAPASRRTMFQEVFEEDFTYIRGFLRSVRRYGRREALIDPPTDRVWTYASLNESVNQLSNALRDHGVGHGDVILYQLPNSPEFIFCYLAPQKLGAVTNPANTSFSPAETAVCLKNSKPKVYIYDSTLRESAEKALELCEEKPEWILMVGEGPLPEGHIRFEDFVRDYPKTEPKTDYVPHIYDEVVRLYTSGTTGMPKGVPITNANEVLSCHDVLMHFPMNSTDVTMNTTPWFHRGGIHSGGPSPTFYTGGKVIILRSFQPNLALNYAERFGITFLISMPSLIKMLLRKQEHYGADLSRLRGIVTMGAPFERSDCMKVQKILTPNVFNGYGTTETFWNTFLRPYDLPEMAGSAGCACTDDEVRVVKIREGRTEPEELVACDETETGEVIIRSPKSSYCYCDDPEEEKEKFYKGWMYTGDLATWDQNGYLTITGRKDDMLISGGENIYPLIIEEVLNSHPKVQQSAITGVPDNIRGEAVAAYIVPADDSLTVSELAQHCQQSDQLSVYKRPRYYRFVRELPTTATGKLQHYLVREMALNDLENGLLKLAASGGK